MRRLALLFAALLACGLIAVGCGDDDDEDNADDSAAITESVPAVTTPETDTTSETDTTTSGDDTTSGDADTLDEGVQACKDYVRSAAAQLSEDLRGDFEELCDKTEGNKDDLRAATREICKKIVDEVVPEGTPRDQALAVCDTAKP